MAQIRTIEELVEARIDKIRTQYRESPKLINMVRVYMTQVAEVMHVINSIPDYFDLDNAVGEQLTFLGKRIGWTRNHCVCTVQPIFGFDCDNPPPVPVEPVVTIIPEITDIDLEVVP